MTIVDVLVCVTPNGDNGQSAQEGHQLILSDDEEFLGIAMLYDGSPPKSDD